MLATSANITLEQLRGFETIFKKLDPDGENEINVTKFVRAGLGRATIQLHLSSRDLRKLFAALRQNPAGPGDPAHISLPVTPNEFLMAMAVPPFFRRSDSLEPVRLLNQLWGGAVMWTHRTRISFTSSPTQFAKLRAFRSDFNSCFGVRGNQHGCRWNHGMRA